MKKQPLIRKISRNSEDGFTLLEYVAGAAIIISLVVVGLGQFGTGLSTFFTDLGQWATSQGARLSSASSSTGTGG